MAHYHQQSINRKNSRSFLFLICAPLSIGIIFTGLTIYLWLECLWKPANQGAIAVVTAFEIFAGPLLLGTIQVLRGKKSGRKCLRFGSLLFLFCLELVTMIELWEIDSHPGYIEYLQKRKKNQPLSSQINSASAENM